MVNSAMHIYKLYMPPLMSLILSPPPFPLWCGHIWLPSSRSYRLWGKHWIHVYQSVVEHLLSHHHSMTSSSHATEQWHDCELVFTNWTVDIRKVILSFLRLRSHPTAIQKSWTRKYCHFAVFLWMYYSSRCIPESHCTWEALPGKISTACHKQWGEKVCVQG